MAAEVITRIVEKRPGIARYFAVCGAGVVSVLVVLGMVTLPYQGWGDGITRIQFGVPQVAWSIVPQLIYLLLGVIAATTTRSAVRIQACVVGHVALFSLLFLLPFEIVIFCILFGPGWIALLTAPYELVSSPPPVEKKAREPIHNVVSRIQKY